MFFSGIADEAARQLGDQIKAHEELGWTHIELRLIDGTNLTDVDDASFDGVSSRIAASGIQVSCFASQLANWARPVSTDLEVDLQELERAIPRMKKLRTDFIRCMSYPNSDPPLSDDEWRREVVRRLKVLARIAEEGGVVLVHENCDGWGGQGPEHTMRLLEEVGSSHLKLVFDTGNPPAHGQDAWSYYVGVRDEIAYVHIKDYTEDGRACFPGEGKGYVREIITDLLARGYDGGFSIEPHITSVIHAGKTAADPKLAHTTYVEYGRRLERLVEEIRSSSPGG